MLDFFLFGDATSLQNGSNFFSCPRGAKNNGMFQEKNPGEPTLNQLHHGLSDQWISDSKIKWHDGLLRWPVFTEPLIPSKVSWSVNSSILSMRTKRGSLPARWRRLLFPNRRSRTWSTRQSRRWRKRFRELKMAKRLSSFSHQQNVYSGERLRFRNPAVLGSNPGNLLAMLQSFIDGAAA